ncbi:2Fe-2S iron-sulfur cluster-binding protein [Duganella sp. PWIR1]
MTKITFIQPGGREQMVAALEGKSLMETAVRHNVAGIEAECGGSCSCGTCHVIVDGAWANRLPRKNADEESTLDYASGLQDNSRLACQIIVNAALDGLVVRLP